MIEMRWVRLPHMEKGCVEFPDCTLYPFCRLEYRYKEPSVQFADASDWQWSPWLAVQPPNTFPPKVSQ